MKKDLTSEEMAELGRSQTKPVVSNAVIKRLPRYFRYLRILIREGKTRISSAELSKRMNVTASQIRQDLNCFGGFGQQGYGYNVNYLYAKICELLGVGEGFHAILIGAGNLGRALVKGSTFEKRGVDVIGIFDVSPEIVGKQIGRVEVLHIDELESFCERNRVDIAVLTLPKDCAESVFERIVACNIPGVWNFTGKGCHDKTGGTTVEAIHIGDSLMTLCYDILQSKESRARESIERLDDFDGK